jgi:hypothetical protein
VIYRLATRGRDGVFVMSIDIPISFVTFLSPIFRLPCLAISQNQLGAMFMPWEGTGFYSVEGLDVSSDLPSPKFRACGGCCFDQCKTQVRNATIRYDDPSGDIRECEA